MFCCLHSSFLGELTFVTAFIYQCNNAGFLYLSLLPSVQGKSLFHFVGTLPKIIKKKFGYQGSPIYGRVTAAAFMKS